MINNCQEFNNLSWGKFHKYDSLLFKTQAWRVGTIADGSCFFHAILTATNKSYRNIKNRKTRCDKVANIRKKISNKITLDTWEFLQNGEPAHFEFLQKINECESVISKVLKNPEKYKESKTKSWIVNSTGEKSCEIINKVLGNNIFNMTNFSKACTLSDGHYMKMSECENIFIKHQLKFYVKRIENVLKNIIVSCESGEIEQSVVDYKNLLKKIINFAKKSA